MRVIDDVPARNRIHVVNWRKHGADESTCKIGVYAADDPEGDALREVKEDEGIEDVDDPESVGDFENLVYVNDDFTIEDGQTMEHKGRSFLVTITEVKE